MNGEEVLDFRNGAHFITKISLRAGFSQAKLNVHRFETRLRILAEEAYEMV